MDWIFDHFQILVAIGAAFAYWLKRRRDTANEEEPPAPPSRRVAPPPAPSVETVDDHVRRIQEEIRRKIQERAGRAPVAPMPQPAQQRETELRREMPRPSTTMPEPPPLPQRKAPAGTPTAAVLAEQKQQREWTEELRRAEEARRESRRVAARAEAASETALASELAGVSANLSESLRHPGSLRTAIALREILGPPVGLR